MYFLFFVIQFQWFHFLCRRLVFFFPFRNTETLSGIPLNFVTAIKSVGCLAPLAMCRVYIKIMHHENYFACLAMKSYVYEIWNGSNIIIFAARCRSYLQPNCIVAYHWPCSVVITSHHLTWATTALCVKLIFFCCCFSLCKTKTRTSD